MMPRYIDAEGLNLYDDLFMKGKNDSGVWVRYKDVERLIWNAPTADVQEVKHGAWINEYNYGDDFYHTCDQCHTEQLVNYYDEYCAKCGAKMDGKGSRE